MANKPDEHSHPPQDRVKLAGEPHTLFSFLER